MVKNKTAECAHSEKLEKGYTILIIISPSSSISQSPCLIKANIRYASPSTVAAYSYGTLLAPCVEIKVAQLSPFGSLVEQRARQQCYARRIKIHKLHTATFNDCKGVFIM